MKVSLHEYQDFLTALYDNLGASISTSIIEFHVIIAFGKSPKHIMRTLMRKVFNVAITPNAEMCMSEVKKAELMNDMYRMVVVPKLHRHPELRNVEVEI